jgi:hypothetical protein
MLVVFLNELSCPEQNLEKTSAQQVVLELLKLLRNAKKIQPQIALHSQLPLNRTLLDSRYTLAELLSGNEFKEEWRFLRGFENRSPLNERLPESFSKTLLELEYRLGNKLATAIGWADLLDTAVVSFNTNEDCQPAELQVIKSEFENDEINDTAIVVRNLVSQSHLSTYQNWIKKYGLENEPSGDELWDNRKQYFPYLRFLDRVQNDLSTLKGSLGYKQLIIKLRNLNDDIEKWQLTREDYPEYSTKATPEAETRKRLCYLNDGGNSYCFDWHVRFTGSIPGRIHFRLCNETKTAVIGYLGRKLETPIVS